MCNITIAAAVIAIITTGTSKVKRTLSTIPVADMLVTTFSFYHQVDYVGSSFSVHAGTRYPTPIHTYNSLSLLPAHVPYLLLPPSLHHTQSLIDIPKKSKQHQPSAHRSTQQNTIGKTLQSVTNLSVSARMRLLLLNAATAVSAATAPASPSSHLCSCRTSTSTKHPK